LAVPRDATATQPISHDVLKEKYLKAGESGFEDVYRRVARALASVEAEADRAKYEACFWKICVRAPLVRGAS
jgi:ribonucleoside-diphosphate reductase alpha chain